MPEFPTLAEVAELPNTYETTIPDSYLDEMGHMNVMWYTHLFGRGIRGILDTVGLDLNYIEQQQAGTFALEKHIRYLAEVRVGDHVSVYTRVVARNGSRFHLVQFMVNNTSERLASIMETISTHVDLVARRSSPMPVGIAEKWDRLAESHSHLAWPAPLCGVMGV